MLFFVNSCINKLYILGDIICPQSWYYYPLHSFLIYQYFLLRILDFIPLGFILIELRTNNIFDTIVNIFLIIPFKMWKRITTMFMHVVFHRVQRWLSTVLKVKPSFLPFSLNILKWLYQWVKSRWIFPYEIRGRSSLHFFETQTSCCSHWGHITDTSLIFFRILVSYYSLL